MNKIPFFATIFAALGVALGAFGAHGLEEFLRETGRTEVWETAVFYHLIHAIAAWSASFCPILINKLNQRASICWLGGIILFSGSLYALAMGGPKWLGPITPIGGSLFIVGWGVAATSAWTTQKNDHDSARS